jgi:hypothetical protein
MREGAFEGRSEKISFSGSGRGSDLRLEKEGNDDESTAVQSFFDSRAA